MVEIKEEDMLVEGRETGEGSWEREEAGGIRKMGRECLGVEDEEKENR